LLHLHRYITLARPLTPTLFPYTTLFRSLLQRRARARAALGERASSRALPRGHPRARHRGRDRGAAQPRAGTRRVLLHRAPAGGRSEEHTSELQSLRHLVCRLLLEKKKKK